MRPRPNGRGNHAGALGPIPGGMRFNEAAAEWPRELQRGRMAWPRLRSFNEAAAEWPREFGFSEAWAARLFCFNEAAAEWPREYHLEDKPCKSACCFNEAAAEWPRECRHARIGGRKLGASMRPRPNGRGNEWWRRSWTTPPGSFNEAAAEW